MRRMQFVTAYFLGVSGIAGGVDGWRVLRRAVASASFDFGVGFGDAALATGGFGATVFAGSTAFEAGFTSTGFGAFSFFGVTAGFGAAAVSAALGLAAVLGLGAGAGFTASLTIATLGFAAVLRAARLGFEALPATRWLVKSGADFGAGDLATVGVAMKGAHSAWLSTIPTRSCCSTVFPKNCHPATVALTGSTSKFIWIVLYFLWA
ncbi:hypothetical protein [Cognatishimia activa]|uniref:hypothetical protein n=1 Tax=Cognatishimia activa TaxID=1715691 RepID=UPI002231ED1E|nr:hypothetical protein [Cognatishimia activa]UZD91393.1 hypothetical protein M0D42_01885 [Cognatishimia activa]